MEGGKEERAGHEIGAWVVLEPDSSHGGSVHVPMQLSPQYRNWNQGYPMHPANHMPTATMTQASTPASIQGC